MQAESIDSAPCKECYSVGMWLVKQPSYGLPMRSARTLEHLVLEHKRMTAYQ